MKERVLFFCGFAEGVRDFFDLSSDDRVRILGLFGRGDVKNLPNKKAHTSSCNADNHVLLDSRRTQAIVPYYKKIDIITIHYLTLKAILRTKRTSVFSFFRGFQCPDHFGVPLPEKWGRLSVVTIYKLPRQKREVNMGKIVDALQSGKVLVSDGAWGTFLYEKGLKPGECPDVWSVDRFDDVVDIAKSYIEAGADMVESNSFGASCYKLEHFGLQDKAAEISEFAAKASKKAAGDKFVIASIGPTGKMLITEEVTEEDLYEAFKVQAIALEKGGADAVCIETMSDADEACCAIRATKENTNLEIITTFSFERTVQGSYKTMMGLAPVDAVEAALDAGSDIVGTNCGNGIERMIEIVTEMKAARPDAYILVHANAGLPQNVDGKDFFPETPDMMAAQVEKLIEAGADIVGGCCGTTPAHIAAIKKVVDVWNKKTGK